MQQFIRDTQTGLILGIIIAIGIVVIRKTNP